MAVRHGYGKVATEGLVFAYDTGDTVNSYKGEPTENLIPNPYFIDGNGNPTISGYGTFGFSHDNTIAATSLPSAVGNGYSAKVVKNTTTNGTIVESVTIPALNTGDTVVVSWYAKGYGGSESQTCQTHCYVNSSAGAISTGTYSTVTSEWKRFYHVLTWTKEVSSNTSANSYFYSGFGTGTEFQVANPQVEVYKAHPTQFVNGTRSVSGSLLDLTGLGGLNLSNVSFDSNAQMTFDGTDDKIELGDTFDLADHFVDNQSFTIEAMVKLYNTDTNLNGGIFSNQKYQTQTDAPGFGLCIRYANSTLQYCMNIVEVDNSVQTSYESKISIPANIGNLEHVTYIYDNTTSTMYGYINGELIKSDTNATYNWSLPVDTTRTRIGISTQGGWEYYHEMDLPVVKCYNRALTADEVRNNYRHYKNRFNI